MKSILQNYVVLQPILQTHNPNVYVFHTILDFGRRPPTGLVYLFYLDLNVFFHLKVSLLQILPPNFLSRTFRPSTSKTS